MKPTTASTAFIQSRIATLKKSSAQRGPSNASLLSKTRSTRPANSARKAIPVTVKAPKAIPVTVEAPIQVTIVAPKAPVEAPKSTSVLISGANVEYEYVSSPVEHWFNLAPNPNAAWRKASEAKPEPDWSTEPQSATKATAFRMAGASVKGQSASTLTAQSSESSAPAKGARKNGSNAKPQRALRTFSQQQRTVESKPVTESKPVAKVASQQPNIDLDELDALLTSFN